MGNIAYAAALLDACRGALDAFSQAPNATAEQVAIFQARQAAGLNPWPPYEPGWQAAEPWPPAATTKPAEAGPPPENSPTEKAQPMNYQIHRSHPRSRTEPNPAFVAQLDQAAKDAYAREQAWLQQQYRERLPWYERWLVRLIYQRLLPWAEYRFIQLKGTGLYGGIGVRSKGKDYWRPMAEYHKGRGSFVL